MSAFGWKGSSLPIAIGLLAFGMLLTPSLGSDSSGHSLLLSTGGSTGEFLTSTGPAGWSRPAIPVPVARDGPAISGSNATVATISVGLYPQDIIYDSGAGQLFVSNYDSNSVSVISAASDQVIATIDVGLNPTALAYDPALGEVFVANTGGVTPLHEEVNISVINDRSDSVVATIPFGLPPGQPSSDGMGLAYDSGRSQLFVAIGAANEVSVLDPSNDEIEANISLNSTYGHPCQLVYAPLQGEVLASDCFVPGLSERGEVVAIDDSNDTVSAVITVGGTPGALAYDAALNETFVAQLFQNNLSVIDNANDSFAGSVPEVSGSATNGYPEGLAYDPTTREVLVAEVGCAPFVPCGTGAPGLGIVNASTGATLANVPAGNGPDAVAYDPQLGRAFVTDSGFAEDSGSYDPTFGGNVTVLDVDRPLPYGLNMAQTRLSTDVGEPVWFNTSADGYLGTLSFSYAASALSGCNLQNSSVVECLPNSAGNFTLWLNATNSFGYMLGTHSATVAVAPQLGAKLVLTTTALWLGDSLGISAEVSGGLGPDVYSFSGLPPGCAASGGSQLGCLPTDSGNYTVSVAVTDANQWRTGAEANLRVEFAFDVSTPSTVTEGLAFAIHVASAPGFGGLSYDYTGLPPGCLGTNTSTLTCTPQSAGVFSVGVTVHDGAGDYSTQSVRISVVPGFLGLYGNEGYIALGGALLAVVAVASLLAVRRRKAPITSLGPTAGLENPRSVRPPEASEQTDEIEYLRPGETDLASDLF